MTKIIHDPSEIESLADAWNELAEQFRTPLLRNEWFAACAEAYCQPGQLQIVINNSQRGIDAIAPLVLVKSRGLKIMALLGASPLGEPSGFIYRDNESAEELINKVIQMGKPVLLSRLRSKAPEVFTLRKVNKKRSVIVLRNSAGSPFLPITTSWTEFQTQISARQRYDLGRAKKRAEKSGGVEFEIVSPKPETSDDYLEEFVRVEATGWKGREGTALFADERLRKFYFLYAKATSLLNTLRVCFLRVNNKPAAVLLAVEYFNRFWVLKIGYDEAFSRCSPGILLIHETIRYAFENGLEAFEFLGNDAPWIHMWTEQQHAYVTARIYPFSISGQLSLGLEADSAVVHRARKIIGK